MGFESGKVASDATIRAALESLERSGLEIVMVTDAGDRLLGLMTDGDIRRVLLRGAALEEPAGKYMQRKFTHVTSETSRAEVLDLMQARGIGQIPVLDRDGRLVGLHTIREVLGGVERPNWAVVMAGGRGERLRPITDSIPKPMLKVAGRPILERIVLHLVGFGIRRIFLAVNYKAGVIESHFGDGSSLGCSIEYLREDRPLGTGGALSLLPEPPKVPVVVLNGDIITQFDAGGMLGFHSSRGNMITVGVHQHVYTVPYGVVGTSGEKIVSLREKPVETWLVNAGIYVIEPGLLARIPEGREYPLPALVEEAIDRGEPAGAFRVDDDWIDVGRHQELKRAKGEE